MPDAFINLQIVFYFYSLILSSEYTKIENGADYHLRYWKLRLVIYPFYAFSIGLFQDGTAFH